ncbi:MAG: ABC transporter permease [Promethearchaeota archaeon]|nr:MAG: ABC transporter permease [Candidatus Lokiarchaeota archaeon]
MANIYLRIKPIVDTYKFELTKSFKKFLIYTGVIIVILLLSSFIIYLIPQSALPNTQNAYLQGGLGFINFILMFGCCFFFAGVINTEFSKKTGFIVFPKINKMKLLAGKYLANLTLLILSISIYYYFLSIMGIFYYGLPLTNKVFMSFGIAVLYILAVSSFVTLFSSFMKSVNITIITTILILIMAFSSVDSIVVLLYPNFEPLYSLDYMSYLISSILSVNFPTGSERYLEMTIMDFTFRTWLTPTVFQGVIVLSIYLIICLTLALIIFKYRQL